MALTGPSCSRIITLHQTTAEEGDQFNGGVLDVDASVELTGKTAPADGFQVYVKADVCEEDLGNDTYTLRHTRWT